MIDIIVARKTGDALYRVISGAVSPQNFRAWVCEKLFVPGNGVETLFETAKSETEVKQYDGTARHGPCLGKQRFMKRFKCSSPTPFQKGGYYIIVPLETLGETVE